MKLRLIAALAVAASTPALDFANLRCTTNPNSKWTSKEAMEVKIVTLSYEVETFEITGNR